MQQAANRIGLKNYFDLALARVHWDSKQVAALKALLRTYRQVWESPGVVGKATGGEHRIETGDKLPVAPSSTTYCLGREGQDQRGSTEDESAERHS